MTIEIFKLLFAAITVLLAYLGYRKYLQNKLRDKQLDSVCDLVKQIQQEDFHHIWFNDPGNLKSKLATLFDIAEMKEFDDYEKWYYFGATVPDNSEKY